MIIALYKHNNIPMSIDAMNPTNKQFGYFRYFHFSYKSLKLAKWKSDFDIFSESGFRTILWTIDYYVSQSKKLQDLASTYPNAAWAIQEFRHLWPSVMLHSSFHPRKLSLLALRVRAVASLSLPGGQDKNIFSIFPHFPVDSLIFPHFFFIFFLILFFQVGGSPTKEGPGYATPSHFPLWSLEPNLIFVIIIIF